ncbi:hypothetical protein ZIOFF_001923 [Zingiber officinale]|uniref:Uncharacterized protein n=1 Tax=Zingiber officinale TaxID=94328 RepID=A0A8J5M936_ZINOF|nr:hypothetical protein ZIOFF_001923 [Zingiber officinale]
MITAGGPSLFKGGRGCGACYQVLCNSNAACSGMPVTVVVTDQVPCSYRGFNVAFRVDAGSNVDYLAIIIENVNGDGELAAVELMEGSSGTWTAMQPSWGAQWKLNAGRALQPPFSFQLTSGESKKILVAHNVIPVGWTPGNTYTSMVNY